MKKKIIISLSILFVVTILFVGGYFLFSMFQSPAEIEDSDALYETTLKETPTDGSIPTEYNIEDNIAFALYKLSNTKEFKSVTTGSAVAVGVNQSVSNVRVVKDDKAMVSMITSGFIENAKQRYFLKDKVLLRDAVKPLISKTEANWATSEPECVTYNTIKKRYGWFPFEATGYIICEDTFINKDKMKLKENNDRTYTLVFDLDPDTNKAPFWYRREVLTNSNSTIIPEFFSIHIEMTIDENWTILQNEIKESYKVKSFGVEAVTDTSCKEEFFYEDVEFDKAAYDFFESYAYLSALDDSTEDIVVKEDPMSIVVSSLQNKDLSNKKLDIEIDIDGSIIKGNALLNISDLNNVLVVAKIDDLYVSYDKNIYLKLGNLKLSSSLEDIEFLSSKFKFDTLGDGKIDVNSILDSLTKASMEEIDSIIYIDPIINIGGIDIKLHFEIRKNEDSYSLINANASLRIGDKDIGLSIKESNKDIDVLDTNDFISVRKLDFVIEDIVSIINNKELNALIKFNYNDISVDGNISLSFKDSISAYSNLKLKFKDIDENIAISYINDIFYIDLLNNHLKISKEELVNIISKYSNLNTSDIDIKSIIETIKNIDFDKLLNEVLIDDNYLNMKLDLTDLVSVMKDIQLELKKDDYLNINVSSDDINLSIELVDSFEEKNINDGLYIDISGLVNNALDIYDLIDNKSFRLDLLGNIKLDKIEIAFDSYIDFIKEEKSYIINGLVNLRLLDNEFTINLIYKDNILYFTYGNINVGLDLSNPNDFINEAFKRLGLDNNDSNIIKDLLDSLVINEKGIYFDKLLSFNKLKLEIENNKFNILSDELTIDGSITNINSYRVNEPKEYLDNEQVLTILSHIGNVLELIKNESFSVNFDINTYRNLSQYLNIKGQVDFTINKEDNKEFSLDNLSIYVNLAISEYNEKEIKVIHRVELTIVDGYIYANYGNNESNKNSKIKLYSKKESIFGVVSSVLDLIGLDFGFLDDYKTDKLDGIDIQQLKDLFKKDLITDFERLIDSIEVLSSGLIIKLNLHSIFDFIPNGINCNISLDSTKNGFELSLDNLFIDYVSDKENKKIDINSLSIEQTNNQIKKPTNLSGYYEISDIDDLVYGLLHTASNKDYQMETTVNLSILSIINIDVPVDARVRVLEDGSPLVYCHMAVPKVGTLITLLSKKDVYFYYYDGYVYIERKEGSTKYNLKVTYEEFFSDIVYYVLDFAMGMPDIVLNAIKDNKTDEDYVVDAGKVLTNYSYSKNSFSLGLDIGSLTGNSNLGEMSFNLNLEELGIYYNDDNSVKHSLALTSISNFKMKLVKVISLNVSKLTITNIVYKDGYKWFTDINMDDVYNYTSSYNYEVDKIYKNGHYESRISHDIVFYDDAIIKETSYYYNDLISFPNLIEKEVDGIIYVFDGWYLDKYKTKRFDLTTMPAKDIELYAKWVKKD